MTAIICTVISAILGGLLVARFSPNQQRTVVDPEELSSEIAKMEKHVHRIREISSRRGELQVHHGGGIAITSSNEVDVDRYVKPLRKKWKSWAN